ncbi:MAG: glycyl-radical enzyme activating protein [Halanaerobiales bacterium]|nr:glycyl-radical enzyme activating protein [Halanaerobiales bacterium]
MKKGSIFNIQRYSVHDGPGIRTTIFLKGCPLSCWWCHNPESQSSKLERVFRQEQCIGCGTCIKICANKAIVLIDGKASINDASCSLCGECVHFCPVNAVEMMGKIVTVEDVMKEIKKDVIFFDESGGGVTFSGGEPLVQNEFLYDLLDRCKQEEIHTTVDTSGYISWEKLNQIASRTDLFLYDIKLMDNEKHKKYIGVSNVLILENLKKLSESDKKIFARIPAIPGINDDDENIIKTGEFLSKLKIDQVNLLPYHNIGIDKYKKLGMTYKVQNVKVPSDEKMNQLSEILKRMGLNVKIGG